MNGWDTPAVSVGTAKDTQFFLETKRKLFWENGKLSFAEKKIFWWKKIIDAGVFLSVDHFLFSH